MDGHDFGSVRLGISADLAFPRTSVCRYLDPPNWFALTRNSLSRTITILRCCNELPVANFNFHCATSRVHVPVLRQSCGRYLLVFAAIGALKPQLAGAPGLVLKAMRNVGWKRLLNERNIARHVFRVIAKRDTDDIFVPGQFVAPSSAEISISFGAITLPRIHRNQPHLICSGPMCIAAIA